MKESDRGTNLHGNAKSYRNLLFYRAADMYLGRYDNSFYVVVLYYHFTYRMI